MVHRAFALAWRAFPEQGNDVGAWLFTTARAYALDALRYRRDRDGPERKALQFTRVDGNRVPDAAVVFDQALAEFVWDAAAALPRDEYSLLALQVRQELSVEDLGGSPTRLARVQETFDEHVSFRLVAARAWRACTELDLLVRQDDERAVGQHIRRCARSLAREIF